MTVPVTNNAIEQPIGDSEGVEQIISSDAQHAGNRAPGGKQSRPNNQPRRDKRDVHGWVVLDKPIGMT